MAEPEFELHNPDINKSYRVKYVKLPHLIVPLHHHIEIELILIIRGEGIREVGDSKKEFGPGDLVLLGPDLLHVWRNSQRYYQDDLSLWAEARVILFKENCFGEDFFKTTEMQSVQALFKRAQRGIQFHGKTRDSVAAKITATNWKQGNKHLPIFLDILHELADADSRECTFLASPTYAQSKRADRDRRINKILNYLNAYYLEPLTLTQIADEAGLSIMAYCRFFKAEKGKPTLEYLDDLRVEAARKLLTETNRKIDSIYLECGFKNRSNFNKQFKARNDGCKPLEYRNRHQSGEER